jgi:hypothetical protein
MKRKGRDLHMNAPLTTLKSTHEILMEMKNKSEATRQAYLDIEKQAIREGAFKKVLQDFVNTEQNADTEVLNTELDGEVLDTKPNGSHNYTSLFRPSFFGYRLATQSNNGIPGLRVTSKDLTY